MIVVDVETTGTDEYKHSLLSIGAVDMADTSRQFYEECRIWDGAHVSKEALAINGYTEEHIRDPKAKSEGQIAKLFFEWAQLSPDHTMAGMNPMLDLGFLREAADRANINYPLAKRSIDLHTVCFMHLAKRGEHIPLERGHSAINSDFISTYVGIPVEPHPHIALNGALWEAEQLSRLFYDKQLLEQFREYPLPWAS